MSADCPEAGDLIWLDFDPQAGREQAGRRPALVLSPAIFQRKTSLVWVCPITSKEKGFPFEVVLPEGLGVRGVVLCAHLRSLDWRARHAIRIGPVPAGVLAEVRQRVALISGIL